jgi:putative ABC transport system permease protein
MVGMTRQKLARISAARIRRLGREAIRQQRLHTRRTAFGAATLILGVAAFVVMAAVNAGAERQVLERVRAMGSNLLVIQPAVAPVVAGRMRQRTAVTTLRPADADLIADGSALATSAAAGVVRSVVARFEGKNAPTALLGTTTTGLRIQGIAAGQGRVFDDHEEREQRRVAVVGATMARNLFGSASPVGSTVLVGRIPFEIIGVIRRRGTDVGGTDLDNVIVVPLATAMRRVLNVPFVDALFIQARHTSDLDALEREAVAILQARQDARSGIRSEFVVRNQAVLLRTERGARQAFRTLMGATAAVTLIAGALTILATMLLSVRERVPEIAVRRAVGARVQDIQWQFLVESAALALLGGAIGVILGLLAALVGAAAGGWPVAVPWGVLFAGLVVPAITGLTVGALPAVRAAKLDPAVGVRLRA